MDIFGLCGVTLSSWVVVTLAQCNVIFGSLIKEQI